MAHLGIRVRLDVRHQGVELVPGVEPDIPTVVILHLELKSVLGLHNAMLAR